MGKGGYEMTFDVHSEKQERDVDRANRRIDDLEEVTQVMYETLKALMEKTEQMLNNYHSAYHS